MATIEAWKRFTASNPEAQREYRTIEVWHSQFSTVRRFVFNSSVDLSAGLESTAPRNAGATVVFQAATGTITEPAERQDSEQVLGVSFGSVDGTIHDILDQITGVGYFESVQVVYRKYYSGDLTEPAVDPLYLFASGLNFDGPAQVTFSAEDADLSQKRAGSLYTTEAFPGLAE
jgi:hypothetical protein